MNLYADKDIQIMADKIKMFVDECDADQLIELYIHLFPRDSLVENVAKKLDKEHLLR